MVKHDAYGFRNERKSLAANFAQRMHRLVDAPSVPRPDWGTIRWRDPGDIARHPELREISREGLEAFFNEIMHEQATFEFLQRRSAEMSPSVAAAFEEAWVLALIEAQEAVQPLILERIRRGAGPHMPAHLDPKAFEVWEPEP